MSDISVAGASPVQKITSQPNSVDQDGSKVGAGSVASAGAIPDPIGRSYQVISQSLSKFFPTLTGDKIDILVAEATLKLKELVGKTETNELFAKEEQKRQNAAEQREAAEKAQKSMEEAKEAAAKAKKGGLFSKIFGGIAAAVSIAVGVLLIASGFGALAGAALIAATVSAAALIVGGVASALMVVDQVVAENNGGTGMFGAMATKFMEARGFSEEAIEKHAARWDKAFTGIMLTVIAVSAVAGLGAGFVGGASSATASATNVAANAGSKGAAVSGSVVAGTGSTATVAVAGTGSTTVANLTKGASGLASLSMAGTGVSTIVTAVFGYQAGQDQAEAQRKQADVARSQALNELLNDFIDQILARVSGTNSQFNAMLDDIVASIKDRGDTLARAKFAG